MIHDRARQRGAWLGLLAMLLVFVGPLLSQAQAMGRNGVPAWMAELACSAGNSASGQQTAMPEHELAWAKCNYCTLLLNSPALASSVSFWLALADLITPSAAPAPQAGHAAQAVFPGALTRAPPGVLP